MDLATIIGIGCGLLLITISILLNGLDSLILFFDIPSILITVGGTCASTMTNFNLRDFLSTFKILKQAFFHKEIAIDEIVATMVKFATIARREGVLALEKSIATIDNDFIVKGIQLAVDGTEEGLTRQILETELEYITLRHSMGQRIFEKMGEYAPSYGMIGTLIGLVIMLKNMDDPTKLGPGMATAIITTFYGSIMANIIFLPIAGKLKNRSAREELEKLVVLEGVISIQAGENPRLVKEKLESFVSKSQRSVEDVKKAA
jgi:chemotaxis protein MotA